MTTCFGNGVSRIIFWYERCDMFVESYYYCHGTLVRGAWKHPL